MITCIKPRCSLLVLEAEHIHSSQEMLRRPSGQIGERWAGTWSWTTAWRWLKVPRSTSCPLSRTWLPAGSI